MAAEPRLSLGMLGVNPASKVDSLRVIPPPGSTAPDVVDVGHHRRTGRNLTIQSTHLLGSLQHVTRWGIITNSDIISNISNISKSSRRILVLACIEAIVLIALQSTILGIDHHLEHHRKGYAIFFILASCYLFVQGIVTVVTRSMMEYFAFIFLNVLITVFGGLQFYEMLSDQEQGWSVASCMALSSCVIAGAFSVVLTTFLYPLYMEYVRELFERIGADPLVHLMYSAYESMSSGAMLLCVLNAIYYLIHLVFLLSPHHVEFGVTVCLMVINAGTTYLARMSVYGMHNKLYLRLFLTALVLEVAYLIYKLYSLDTDSCEFCEKSELWTFLIFYAAVCLFIDFATIVMTINCLRRFGDGMKEAVQRGRTVFTTEGELYMKTPPKRTNRKRSELEVDEEGVVRRRSSSTSKVRAQKSIESKLNRFSFLNKEYSVKRVVGHSKRMRRPPQQGAGSSPGSDTGNPWGRSVSVSSLPSVTGSVHRLSAVFISLEEESDVGALHDAQRQQSGGAHSPFGSESGRQLSGGGRSTAGSSHHLTLNTRDILRQFHNEQERGHTEV